MSLSYQLINHIYGSCEELEFDKNEPITELRR
jgi:hypothetical protein